MEALVITAQVGIALIILNVWLLRAGKSTAWRGGNAQSMREEFAVYGLPPWFMVLVGAFKVLLACLLIAGVWFPALTQFSAAALAGLMLGAVAMHFKVRDPLSKSIPASTLLALCVGVDPRGVSVPGRDCLRVIPQHELLGMGFEVELSHEVCNLVLADVVAEKCDGDNER